ncbi:hypothetical protein V6N13_111881 [Hibiscus sabdariffa]
MIVSSSSTRPTSFATSVEEDNSFGTTTSSTTKKAKASIIGDAILYVQDLQMKAKKLEGEIAGLEASVAGSKRYQEGLIGNPL